jgi:hypothetical protein
MQIDLVPIWTAILAVGVFMYPERTRGRRPLVDPPSQLLQGL